MHNYNSRLVVIFPYPVAQVLAQSPEFLSFASGVEARRQALAQVTEFEVFSSIFCPIFIVSPFAVGRPSAFGDVV